MNRFYIKFESPSIGGERIEVLGWNQEFAHQATKPELKFTKYLDATTSDLLKFCWSGKLIGKATLRCYREDGGGKTVEYLVVTMQHVMISNYAVTGGAGDIPIENISLEFGTIAYEYKGLRPMDGSAVTATYEVETGTIR